MTRWVLYTFVLVAFLFAPMSFAQTDEEKPAEKSPTVSRKLIEIYRIAPGKHESFLRFVAYLDEINVKAGVPPRDLYIHNDGADWDFIIIQPASLPAEKSKALMQAYVDAGAPSGTDFFLYVRQFITEHTDTFATGPTTAQDYLSNVTPNLKQRFE